MGFRHEQPFGLWPRDGVTKVPAIPDHRLRGKDGQLQVIVSQGIRYNVR